MSPSRQENSVFVRLWHRWLYGVGVWFWMGLLFGVAWVLPSRLGDVLEEAQGLPEGQRTAVALLWLATMLICCPLALERLTRIFGITMQTTAPGSAHGPSEENVRRR
jgi:hypothetical protein